MTKATDNTPTPSVGFVSRVARCTWHWIRRLSVPITILLGLGGLFLLGKMYFKLRDDLSNQDARLTSDESNWASSQALMAHHQYAKNFEDLEGRLGVIENRIAEPVYTKTPAPTVAASDNDTQDAAAHVNLALLNIKTHIDFGLPFERDLNHLRLNLEKLSPNSDLLTEAMKNSAKTGLKTHAELMSQLHDLLPQLQTNDAQDLVDPVKLADSHPKPATLMEKIKTSLSQAVVIEKIETPAAKDPSLSPDPDDVLQQLLRSAQDDAPDVLEKAQKLSKAQQSVLADWLKGVELRHAVLANLRSLITSFSEQDDRKPESPPENQGQSPTVNLKSGSPVP